MLAKDCHQYFNPRSPRGERLLAVVVRVCAEIFQSTLPARGATNSQSRLACTNAISIHAPREGSDPKPHAIYKYYHISIHAPREGSDLVENGINEDLILISIHAPREGSDCGHVEIAWMRQISIHAPREGSDLGRSILSSQSKNFNPRSPRGERLNLSITPRT